MYTDSRPQNCRRKTITIGIKNDLWHLYVDLKVSDISKEGKSYKLHIFHT